MVRLRTWQKWGTLATAMLLVGAAAVAGPGNWQQLEPGLDLVRYSTRDLAADPQGDLVILRVDPEQWDLRILATAVEDRGRGLEAWDWCRQYGLMAAINSGMYQADHRTHVGYCKINGKVTNAGGNDYLSAAAFDPIDPSDPPFRIFDLDEVLLGEVAARYRTVVQNLRLVKRAGENRWQPSQESWREAALAEDFRGRCLLIYCQRKMSMHRFNEMLLALPLGLVAAQHLEGSGPAKLWIEHPELDPGQQPWGRRDGTLLPNILGVARRHPQE